MDPAVLVDAIRFKLMSVKESIAQRMREVWDRRRLGGDGRRSSCPGGVGGCQPGLVVLQNETNIKCCSCRACGRTYTSIEAMQVTGADPTEWLCHDDFTRLEYDEEARRRTASNDKRLTQQLAIFTEMLAALKDVEIPRYAIGPRLMSRSPPPAYRDRSVSRVGQRATTAEALRRLVPRQPARRRPPAAAPRSWPGSVGPPATVRAAAPPTPPTPTPPVFGGAGWALDTASDRRPDK